MSVVYLLGHPIGHSLSPAMHNAAFKALGLSHTYEALDVTVDELPAIVQRVRDGAVLGANVTVPHKEAVMTLVDTWDGPTAEIGAANTLSRTADGTRVLASNTDAVGFAYATRHLALDGSRVLLLGAGGAARAVLVALLVRGARVSIANRSAERARTLARAIPHPVDRAARIVEWSERTDLAAVDVVVNATSLGLSGEDPLEGATLRRGLVVVDLIPTAVPTPLARRARAAGADVVDGLPMLLQQAASSFKIWTGRDAPVDVMRAALFAKVS
ncbi:MAG TPA: shikimate dehydrogenase [Candidatus Limnocylindria bacterium]|nr:shikimate dehydrogenase [Candidatus Limnocylindria bacterium]